MESFDRRIFTRRLLAQDVRYLFCHTREISDLMRSRTVTRAFMERIMSVVTAVNDCPYCSWYHAKQALESGVDPDELRRLVSLEFYADASDLELPALLYAQDYAETNRHPDPFVRRRLVEFHGDETAGHISLAIRMITFGNLAGNTFDAFLSRLEGAPAPGSSAAFEFLFFVCSAPFLLPIRPMLEKLQFSGTP